MFDWIGDFFGELFSLIPKVIYFLYASFISLIDLIQLLFRKLAGLDVYYIDGHPVTGDIVTNFIQGILGINMGSVSDSMDYSPLATVFWSFVIFGVIVCFVATLVAIVKSHYSYNEKSAKGPLPIVATAGKALVNIFIVPIIIVFGLWLSQAILTALDDITTTGSSDIESLYGDRTDILQTATRADGTETYIYYDMFGFSGNVVYGERDALGNVADWINNTFDANLPTEIDYAKIAANAQPFSGSIFKVAAYNANRVRNNEYVSDGVPITITGYHDDMNLFNNANGDPVVLADMIDTAFANFLHLDKGYQLIYAGDWEWGDGSDVAYGVNWLSVDRYFTMFTTNAISSFSKFNVGLVWYYYNLWQFNFIVGFGAAIIAISLFINLIFGLMVRFFLCIILFLVMPPLAGLAPLDEGKAFGQWRTTFIKQVIIAYAAVVGMNLVLILLPYINKIDFFDIVIADLVVQTLFIIVGLVAIKNIINVLSQVIGSDDLRAQGDSVASEVKSTVGKATLMTAGAAKLGGKAFASLTGAGIAAQLGARGAKKLGEKIGKTKFGHGVSNVIGGTGAFLKGGVGGVKAFKDMNKAKREQERAEETEKRTIDAMKKTDTYQQGIKADIINSFNGKNNVSEAQLREEAVKRGLSEADATLFARRAVQPGGGKFMGAAASTRLQRADAKYNSFVGSQTYSEVLTRFNNVQGNIDRVKRVQGGIRESAVERYKNANERFAQAQKEGGVVGGIAKGMGSTFTGIGKQMMDNYKTMANTGMKEFMEESKLTQKTDWAKETAQNVNLTNKHMANLARQEEETQQLLRQLYNEFRRDKP